jgi:HK97 family phage portal protein
MWGFFSNLFNNRQTLRRYVSHLSLITNDIPSTAPAPNDIQSYEGAPYVYVAINRIAEACALVPLEVYHTENGKRVRLEEHPFLRLLQNPNPATSRFELLEQTVGFLELTGNAYWYIVGDETGLPSEIWVLRPDRVTIVPDDHQYIKGYLYEVNGRQIALEPIEVVHFKRWHPRNDYYGLSAISAARAAIKSDHEMAQWNANTFGRDHGIPAGIVNLPATVSERDLERIKHEWASNYGSGQRRTAFMRAGHMEWVNVGLSHTDMDFLQGRKANRDEILHIFGVPLGILSENATEANATVAERIFIERTLYPKLQRLAQRITQELLPFYGTGYSAQFEDIRPTDTKLRLAEIQAAQHVLSINEIRQRYYQLPDVAWGQLPVGMEAKEEEVIVEEEIQEEVEQE